MNTFRPAALLGIALLLASCAGPGAANKETNAWPVYVGLPGPPGQPDAWTAAGPLVFRDPAPDGGATGGVRPFWVETDDAAGALRSAESLYPLFTYAVDANTYRWSIFDLINHSGLRSGASPSLSPLEDTEALDVWPFWFSRHTADPATSYRALFPIAGTLKYRLGYDRLSWILFPLYGQSEKRGAVTTATPWPFVRVTRGAATGFALWPLYGWWERPGVERDRFWLWPLGYDSVTQPKPDAPAGTVPTHNAGMLPLYSYTTGPGIHDVNWVWPFFGHTDNTAPIPYRETRWFWPFLVQGRGENHYVNRWGPVYTHSVVNGYDKTWFFWPLLRHANWTEDGLAQKKTQFLFFVYWSLEQRSAANPALPAAGRTNLWPLFSDWDNGAGRSQWQILSPFEGLFTDSKKMRDSWTPIFALIRHDQTAPGETRTSLFWNAISWRHSDAEGRTEIHLGPIPLAFSSKVGHSLVPGRP